LYWALTSLPAPFIDMGRALSIEREIVFSQFPKLKELENKAFTPEEITALWGEIMQLLGEFSVLEDWGSKFAGLITTVKLYPRAKDFLLKEGMSADKVESLPTGQVVMLYQLREFRRIRDDIFKWFSVPYLQARQGAKEAEQRMERMVSEYHHQLSANVFLAVLPALSRAYFLNARLERDVAILRCVEAVRMYAADHDGKLPSSLGKITKVPVPLDPLSGEEFKYTLQGDTAVLEGPAPGETSPKDGVRYELSVRQ
jgi:hypothetical protein